ncbi:MAG: hypothetical protein AAFV07_01805, partial [Bacteroidota bacterium]
LMFALNYPEITQGAILWATPAEHLPEIHEAHPQASGQSFYLINGSQDALATRFFPLRQALVRLGSGCGYQILPGQGRSLVQLKEVLSQGIIWMEEKLATPPPAFHLTRDQAQKPGFQLFPNPAAPNQQLQIQFTHAPGSILEMRLFNEAGILKEVIYAPETSKWLAPETKGNYVVSLYTRDEVFSYRLWVQ